MAEIEENGKIASIGQRMALQEYFVDFLGGLVPGVLFLVAATLSIVPAFYSLGAALSQKHGEPFLQVLQELFRAIQQTPSAIWFILFAGGILFAYIIGHIFYRHDPKTPDRKSFPRLKKQQENDQDETLRRNLGCTNESECEFPYPYYHLYLEQRGFGHLCSLVPWKGSSYHRSKGYINLLKIRLRYYFPEKCGTIIRNEAHVRLASSTWYVSKLLTRFGILGVLVTGSAMAISLSTAQFQSIPSAFSWHILPIVSPITVLLLSYYFRWTIQKFIHYQRLREVFYVLETAYTAFKSDPELLKPPFEEFGSPQQVTKIPDEKMQKVE